MRIALACLVFLSVLPLRGAWAFPENVRHGYTNCASCHINPNGQGLLNDYGRELSKAVQSYGKFFFETTRVGTKAAGSSTESTESGDEQDPESQFLYGYLAKPKWLALGGDIRALQLFQFTPSLNQAQFILMQVDLEAAVTVGRVTIDATLGRVDPAVTGNSNPDFFDFILSRRHYILYQATDNLFVMGGRFWKPYGVLDANHSSAVKESLGWNFGTESYNIEAGFMGESLNVIGYLDLGRPDSRAQIEKGGGGTVSMGFAHSYKAGISYFYGTNDFTERQVFGPWGLLGFTEHFYLNTENDFVLSSPRNGGASSSGFATYNRLGYEWVQGFHTYLEQGFNQQDLFQSAAAVAGPSVQIYGIGLLYYPRTHWEFTLDLQKRQGGGHAPPAVFSDYLYAQLHYYL